MNPDPGTHRGAAGVCQIGIDGNMGGPVQDHEPVVPTPFDFEPFLIHIDDVRLNAAMDLLADRIVKLSHQPDGPAPDRDLVHPHPLSQTRQRDAPVIKDKTPADPLQGRTHFIQACSRLEAAYASRSGRQASDLPVRCTQTGLAS